MPTTQATSSLNFIETHMYMVPPSSCAPPSHHSQITIPPPPPPPPLPQQPMPVPPVNVPNSPVQVDMPNGPPIQQTFLSAPPNGQGLPVSYSYQVSISNKKIITYTILAVNLRNYYTIINIFCKITFLNLISI